MTLCRPSLSRRLKWSRMRISTRAWWWNRFLFLAKGQKKEKKNGQQSNLLHQIFSNRLLLLCRSMLTQIHTQSNMLRRGIGDILQISWNRWDATTPTRDDDFPVALSLSVSSLYSFFLLSSAMSLSENDRFDDNTSPRTIQLFPYFSLLLRFLYVLMLFFRLISPPVSLYFVWHWVLCGYEGDQTLFSSYKLVYRLFSTSFSFFFLFFFFLVAVHFGSVCLSVSPRVLLAHVSRVSIFSGATPFGTVY